MMALIGFFVGLLGSTLKILIETITESKFSLASLLLRKGRFGTMWLVTVLISMALACASALVVVKGEPEAGGSGIPAVMAYLNGISIRRVRGVRACVCALNPHNQPYRTPRPPSPIHTKRRYLGPRP